MVAAKLTGEAFAVSKDVEPVREWLVLCVTHTAAPSHATPRSAVTRQNTLRARSRRIMNRRPNDGLGSGSDESHPGNKDLLPLGCGRGTRPTRPAPSVSETNWPHTTHWPRGPILSAVELAGCSWCDAVAAALKCFVPRNRDQKGESWQEVR